MHSSRMCTAHSSSHLLVGQLSACWDTPRVWAWRPPEVWVWRPPQGVSLETPWDTTLSPTPPGGQTDTCKNITFANYISGGN